MEALFEQLRRLRLLPVVRLEEAAAALPLAEALAAGGLPAAEITFRTPAAADAIRLIAGRMPAVCILAGTVLTVEQARAAVEAGARGIVSPRYQSGRGGMVHEPWCSGYPGMRDAERGGSLYPDGPRYRQALSRRSARWGGHAAGAGGAVWADAVHADRRDRGAESGRLSERAERPVLRRQLDGAVRRAEIRGFRPYPDTHRAGRGMPVTRRARPGIPDSPIRASSASSSQIPGDPRRVFSMFHVKKYWTRIRRIGSVSFSMRGHTRRAPPSTGGALYSGAASCVRVEAL